MRLLAIALVAACKAAPAPVPPSPAIALVDQAPADALALDVGVRRWSCTVTAPDGTSDSDLRVPTGRVVHLTLHADDASTDLDVELGKPIRVARGTPVSLAFRIDRPGSYGWKCPVQRPPGPPHPYTQIVASTPAEYEAHQALLREPNPTTREDQIAYGKKVAYDKGCTACHSVDGTPRVGVSFAHLWGTTVTLSDRSTRVVDAAFVADAVTKPQQILRDGYPPSMPSYEGQLRPEQLAAITTYIESLR